MFGRKYCKACKEKISSKYRFCPSCGAEIESYSEGDWGLLGREDFVDEESLFFSGFGGRMFNSLLGSAFKMLEKEMGETEKSRRANFRLMVNGKEIKFSDQKKPREIKKEQRREFEEKQIKRISELPKKEPKTSLRRIGDKIIYEIEMPEVRSLKDVVVNNLENSIEIKAIGNSEVYSKVIPVKMPIINQRLSEGKLILELKG